MNPAVTWAMDALRNPTPAECALETAVAAIGLPYRAQWPLLAFRYRADFALITERVIFEVDDPGHDDPGKVEKDAERTAALAADGWTVVRCTNDEALKNPWATVNRMLRQAGLYITVEPGPRGYRAGPTGLVHDVPSHPVVPVDPLRHSRKARGRARAGQPKRDPRTATRTSGRRSPQPRGR